MWYDVNEKLPKRSGHYITVFPLFDKKDKPYIDIMVYFDESNMWHEPGFYVNEDGAYIKMTSVTHWKPLPRPPKDVYVDIRKE